MKMDIYPNNPSINEQVISNYDATNRSIKERAFHAILFETVALIICAPLFAFLLNRSASEMGLMTLIIATIAVIWNFIYNAAFDRITRGFIQERGFIVRIIHAGLFESGLIIITVPLIAWVLKMTLLEALIMDIGILLFFFPYTVIFNWAYDAVRKVLWIRKAEKIKG